MVYAHSLEKQPLEKWQTLEEHAAGVAALASDFAKPFNSNDWARLASLLHDIGKARKSFQNYLLRSNGLVDEKYDGSDHSHSGVGAVWAVQARRDP